MSNLAYFSQAIAANEDPWYAMFGTNFEGGERISNVTTHQVSIFPSTGATGFLKIGFFPVTNLSLYPNYVKDETGADLLIDLADGPQSFVFDAAVSNLGTVPDGTITVGYQATFAGW